MGKKCGNYAVTVTNTDTGESREFLPGDDFGDFEKFIDNPLAFEGGEEARDEERAKADEKREADRAKAAEARGKAEARAEEAEARKAPTKGS